MQILGRHSLSQRRKSSKRPRDLHIRKISLSGCSLCSDSSASTVSNLSPRTPIASEAITTSQPSSPERLAPLPLSERRFISPPRRMPQQRYTEPVMTTFLNDSDDDDEDVLEGKSEAGVEKQSDGFFGFHFDFDNEDGFTEQVSPVNELPSLIRRQNDEAPLETTGDKAPDYFFARRVLARPNLVRSHWSESTIHTIDTLATAELDDDAEPTTPTTEVSFGTAEPRIILSASTISGIATALSYPSKTADQDTTPTAEAEPIIIAPTPQRPAMPAMDAVEDLIKRGGWKRRGIIFHQEEVCPGPDECEGCA